MPPAIVVFPQVPEKQNWILHAHAAMSALDRTIAEFNGDRTRIYLTGMSMGGYGSWNLALEHPDRFAALVVICGGLTQHGGRETLQQPPRTAGAADPYAVAAKALRHIPIRIYHGADDNVVPPSESRQMNEALVREGADVKYIEYPKTNHNAWDPTYGDKETWTWLFAQRRP
jgi:predicted peptidase